MDFSRDAKVSKTLSITYYRGISKERINIHRVVIWLHETHVINIYHHRRSYKPPVERINHVTRTTKTQQICLVIKLQRDFSTKTLSVESSALTYILEPPSTTNEISCNGL